MKFLKFFKNFRTRTLSLGDFLKFHVTFVGKQEIIITLAWHEIFCFMSVAVRKTCKKQNKWLSYAVFGGDVKNLPRRHEMILVKFSCQLWNLVVGLSCEAKKSNLTDFSYFVKSFKLFDLWFKFFDKFLIRRRERDLIGF